MNKETVDEQDYQKAIVEVLRGSPNGLSGDSLKAAASLFIEIKLNTATLGLIQSGYLEAMVDDEGEVHVRLATDADQGKGKFGLAEGKRAAA